MSWPTHRASCATASSQSRRAAEAWRRSPCRVGPGNGLSALRAILADLNRAEGRTLHDGECTEAVRECAVYLGDVSRRLYLGPEVHSHGATVNEGQTTKGIAAQERKRGLPKTVPAAFNSDSASGAGPAD